MAIGMSASERVKPYIAAVFGEEGTVVETGDPIGEYTALQFLLEMMPETYNDINWATCHARVTTKIQHIDKEVGNERTSNIADTMAKRMQLRAEQNRPKVGGVKPPWIPPITVRITKDMSNPNQLTVVWELDIPTAIAPLGGNY